MTPSDAAALEDPWDEVVGQPAAVDAVRAALGRDEVAHAWLFVGPREVGQQALARAFACALNCPDAPASDRGCGTCSTCARIRRGVHPATTDFSPEGAQYVVDTVREDWIPTATRTMAEGRRRVLRIERADRMNDAAQSSFLKILEEPPPSVVWVLELEDPSALLDTVLSRCRRLELVPLGPAAMRTLAATHGIAEEQRDALARAAMGIPTRLRDLADPDIAQARWRHLDLIDRLATGGPGAVVPLAKELTTWAKGRSAAVRAANTKELDELKEQFGVDGPRGTWPPGVKTRITKRHERLERAEQRRSLGIVLDDLGSYLRDLLAAHGGASADAFVNVDHVAAIQRDVDRVAPEDLLVALRGVTDCREALERNGAPELHLERILMGLALAIYARSARARAG